MKLIMQKVILLFFVLYAAAFYSYSYAASNNQNASFQNQPYVRIAFGSFDVSEVSGGDIIRGSFKAVNDFNEAFFGVVYRIEVYQGVQDPKTDPFSQKLIHRDTITDLAWKFDIDRASSKDVAFSFRLLPNYPPDTYTFRITLYSSAGIPMGWKDIILKVRGSGRWLMQSGDGQVIKEGDRSYGQLEGPTFNLTDSNPRVKFAVMNLSGATLRAKYAANIFDRFVYGQDPKAVATGNDFIAFKPKAVTPVEIEFPKIKMPGSYVAVVRFVDESNEVVSEPMYFRWVVGGPSAEILSFSMGAGASVPGVNPLKAGDSIPAVVRIAGPADGSGISNGKVRLIFKNDRGEPVAQFEKNFSITAAKTRGQAIGVGTETAEVSFSDIKVPNTISYTQVTAVVEADGITLKEKTIMPPVTPGLPGREPLNAYVLLSLAVIIAIFILVLVIKKFMRGKIPPAAVLCLFIALGIMFLINNQALAACTATYYCPDHGGDDNSQDCIDFGSFIFDPIPSIATVGDQISISGSFSATSNHCLNTNNNFSGSLAVNGKILYSTGIPYSGGHVLDTGIIYYNFGKYQVKPEDGGQKLKVTVTITVSKTSNCSTGGLGPISETRSATQEVTIINRPPVAEAGISKDGVNYSKSITVVQGAPTNITLSADKDVDGDGLASRDPDGWNNPYAGISSGGKCEWNTDLNQGVPTFEKVIDNPSSPSACNVSLGTLIFNDPVGTYHYLVLRLTDRAGAQSPITDVYVTVAPAESHLACVNNTCSLVPGPGSNKDGCKSLSESCGAVRSCNSSNQCVIGGGGKSCFSDADCSVIPARSCNSSNQCVIGGGGKSCFSDADCSGGGGGGGGGGGDGKATEYIITTLGESVTLSWSSLVSSCVLNGGDLHNVKVPGSGSYTFTPSSVGTFEVTVTCGSTIQKRYNIKVLSKIKDFKEIPPK